MYESGGSGPGPGGDDDPPSQSGPIDRSFVLERVTVIDDFDCPAFPQQDSPHGIDVFFDTILVEGFAAANATIRSEPAREASGNPPNLVFTVRETWDNGVQIMTPDLSYQVWVDGNLVTGIATASFSCTYRWSVSG